MPLGGTVLRPVAAGSGRAGPPARPRSRGRAGAWLAAAVAALALLVPLAAGACPVCRSETGRAVRAGIVDSAGAATVAALLAPFAVLAAIVLVLHFGWPVRRGPREGRDGA